MPSDDEKSSTSSFPEVVYRMVEEESQIPGSPIEWVEDGESFAVQPRDPDLAKILSKYFSHSRYSSLQRQLNLYGFKKHLSGPFRGCFYHPHFCRGETAKLELIKRRPQPRRSKKKMTTLPDKAERLKELPAQHSG